MVHLVMSILLPRKDFHPHTIQKVNISICRDCRLWPDVHVAHCLSLTVQGLYDHVHLFKEVALLFIKTVKDVRLSRRGSLNRRSNIGTSSAPTTERDLPGLANSMRRVCQPRAKHLEPLQHRHQKSISHTQSAQTNPRPRASPPPRPFAPPQQQQQEQFQPGRLYYSEVVRGAAGSTCSELRAIQYMLSTLCSSYGPQLWLVVMSR